MKVLESFWFETISLILISLYTVFIIFWLTLADLFSFINDKMMSQIDTAFLVMFLIEIIMKTFASSLRYLFDKFNCFDAVIVVVSFTLNM